MEWQETSLEWCSVSHPLCLYFISGPWRNSIRWAWPDSWRLVLPLPGSLNLLPALHRQSLKMVLLTSSHRERGFQMCGESTRLGDPRVQPLGGQEEAD